MPISHRDISALRMRRDGKTFREIGVELGVTPGRVKDMVAKAEAYEAAADDPFLALSTRARNLLRTIGVDTVDQLRKLTPDYFKSGVFQNAFGHYSSYGPVTIAEIASFAGWPEHKPALNKNDEMVVRKLRAMGWTVEPPA